MKYALIVFAALALAACGAPPGVSTVARLASEDRTTSQITEDNRILIAFNRAVAGESGALFRDVSTDVYLTRMMLTGAVATAPAKARAEAIARGVQGVGQIVNEIQVTSEGGVGATANDLVIEQKLGVKLLAADGVRSVNFRYRAVNGTVYLFGRAHSQAELDKAMAEARSTDNVRRVVSHVQVRP
ncbi:MAG: BON domain-containing protein [Rhodospirillales bacterium]|jgi:osmotically-inducible protein OsmY